MSFLRGKAFDNANVASKVPEGMNMQRAGAFDIQTV
jgi:hypothetical protein